VGNVPSHKFCCCHFSYIVRITKSSIRSFSAVAKVTFGRSHLVSLQFSLYRKIKRSTCGTDETATKQRDLHTSGSAQIFTRREIAKLNLFDVMAFSPFENRSSPVKSDFPFSVMLTRG
jgi:hypothetical protein